MNEDNIEPSAMPSIAPILLLTSISMFTTKGSDISAQAQSRQLPCESYE